MFSDHLSFQAEQLRLQRRAEADHQRLLKLAKQAQHSASQKGQQRSSRLEFLRERLLKKSFAS